jgi:hypothetical protein
MGLKKFVCFSCRVPRDPNVSPRDQNNCS